MKLQGQADPKRCPSLTLRFFAADASDMHVSLPFRCRQAFGQSFTFTFLDADGSIHVRCICDEYNCVHLISVHVFVFCFFSEIRNGNEELTITLRHTLASGCHRPSQALQRGVLGNHTPFTFYFQSPECVPSLLSLFAHPRMHFAKNVSLLMSASHYSFSHVSSCVSHALF